MQGLAFYQAVIESPSLVWLGILEGKSAEEDEALVVHTDSGIKHALTIRTVLENTWEELEAVLLGKRTPKVMIHLTRIVGYYSRVQNWNRSKLAELKDRRRGQYAPPEGVTDGRRRT